MTQTDKAKAYADYYEVIAPDTLDRLGAMLAEDVVFIDPFNKIEGKAQMVIQNLKFLMSQSRRVLPI